MQENKALFATMPIPKALATLAIPTIISQLITMIYNLADTFFIGRTNDHEMVAAASLSFVLFFVMNALANLFGIGGGSLISRMLGAGRDREARLVCAFSFYGTIAIALIYSLSALFFMEPMLRLVGASDATLGYASEYTLWVVVIGGVPTTLAVMMSHILRGEGYATHASFGLALGGVLNILLDPLFMFVVLEPGREVLGAGIATMLSNLVALIYFAVVFFVLRGRALISISPRDAAKGVVFTGEIMKVGFPSALGTMLACVSNICINNLVSSYGDYEMAAMGIVKKIDMLPMNVGMGLCQGMMPLVAFNYASKDYRRMREAARCARICGIVFAILCILVFEVFAGQIVLFFIEDPETVRLGTYFLRICCLATPLMVSNIQFSYTFQAMGKGKESLILSACRQGLVNIPLLFIMNALFAVDGVLWTQIIADVITLTVSAIMYAHFNRRLNAEIAEGA